MRTQFILNHIKNNTSTEYDVEFFPDSIIDLSSIPKTPYKNIGEGGTTRLDSIVSMLKYKLSALGTNAYADLDDIPKLGDIGNLWYGIISNNNMYTNDIQNLASEAVENLSNANNIYNTLGLPGSDNIFNITGKTLENIISDVNRGEYPTFYIYHKIFNRIKCRVIAVNVDGVDTITCVMDCIETQDGFTDPISLPVSYASYSPYKIINNSSASGINSLTPYWIYSKSELFAYLNSNKTPYCSMSNVIYTGYPDINYNCNAGFLSGFDDSVMNAMQLFKKKYEYVTANSVGVKEVYGKIHIPTINEYGWDPSDTYCVDETVDFRYPYYTNGKIEEDLSLFEESDSLGLVTRNISSTAPFDGKLIKLPSNGSISISSMSSGNLNTRFIMKPIFVLK